jgi:acetyl-CoA carboxylase biotin carboxylase subunit
MFKKILIANRGEIALRIQRACREMGIKSVIVYSESDREAKYVKLADEAVCIGPAASALSYLNMPAIISTAEVTDAEAIHPGYGFLSENADFAERVEKSGFVFIGPAPESIRLMGDKVSAKQSMIKSGVPCVPGSEGALPDDPKEVIRIARTVGYPVIIKAAGGGGGRGMRVVHTEAALIAAVQTTRAEAGAAFGNPAVYMEKFLQNPRHIEIQVLADQHKNAVWLGERDCSMQRRHQKIIEEAPSPAVSPTLRRRMGEVACTVAREVGYRGAGTVEFLLEGDSAFWFMEMNTRLQVEHSVTEALVGADLVEWQLLVAQGAMLPMTQDAALARFEAGGHAIEARLCAEDPAQGYLPQSGRIVRWAAPALVRCDHSLSSGCDVPLFYDSMLAKIIAHAPTRAGAISRLASALDGTVCLGVPNNRAFLARVLRDEAFGAGAVDTGFLARHFPDDPSRACVAPSWLEALAAASFALLPRAALPALWAGWSSSPVVDLAVPIGPGEAKRRWRLLGRRDKFVATCEGASHTIARLGTDDTTGSIDADIDGRPVRAIVARAAGTTWLLAEGAEIAVTDQRLVGRSRDAALTPGLMLAPMHGRVTQALVAAGAAVEAGALLLVIEAMKMEHQIRAPHAGKVVAVHARVGDQVAARQPLVEVSA